MKIGIFRRENSFKSLVIKCMHKLTLEYKDGDNNDSSIPKGVKSTSVTLEEHNCLSASVTLVYIASSE